jgi:prepilin-type N-terminal cleavage/methylation domain-containing protein
MISPKSHSSRAGFTLAELIIALLLLGTVTAVLMPVLYSTTAQRQASELRQRALIHAENLLDDLLSQPWDEQTQELLTRKLTAEPADSALPGLERTVTVSGEPEQSRIQITIQLRWRNRTGGLSAPLRLSGWSFAPLPEAT